MFEKVLIANRGALAVRIIRTLHQLNVKAVCVYAESDAQSLHIRLADEAYSLGEGPAADTYLNTDKLFAIADKSGAKAIHPGYGFLSENAQFVSLCEEKGIAFIGPTVEQIQSFGLKHKARELAMQADVPLSPGSDLLKDLDEACAVGAEIGYPVMLKSTAGGGGIGMQVCADEEELRGAFDSVRRLGANNFADDGVFLEKFIGRARHIEVQVFGDGQGNAIAIGERDCSSQRRNQKVVEECPAPNLSDEERKYVHDTAARLLASVSYRSAGTVEFIFDADTNEFYFLEVNTRLQVEHGVTEEVYGVDLVKWMVQLAASELPELDYLAASLEANGHAIQVRLYAEDPYRNFQPCPGLLSNVSFPHGEGVRIDAWVESGIEVSPFFDPMVAKVIVHDAGRQQALTKLSNVLAETCLYGSETNLNYLQALLKDKVLLNGEVTTRYLNDFSWQPNRIDVLSAGTHTTIQDYPARSGYWHVGVPPSGPFDSYSFQLANRLLNNNANHAGLEITMQGPTLKFSINTAVVLCGAHCAAKLDGEAVAMWQVITVKAGQELAIGRVKEQGARAYLGIQGGIDCPEYLGSRSTFTLGQFGGHNGRALRTGDVLHLLQSEAATTEASVPAELIPAIENTWQLRVIYGPHGAPDFFTDEDIEVFFDTDWEVHYNSSRTGVRLIGPKPNWARKDGGEAGLHPSNIHDNAYAFGTVDFTGDMPVILGPDGPSLGGFVCPATVITADLWKLGQLRAGDKIRFVPVTLDDAVVLEANQQKQISNLCVSENSLRATKPITPVVKTLAAEKFGDEIVYRLAGDHFLLVEYGEKVLDIRLRFRAHALMQWLQKNPIDGLRELTPGIRSLQIHYDSQTLSCQQLLDYLYKAEQALSQSIDELRVPSRVVHLPLSWDDEVCQKAIDKYTQSVRKNAPWCPSNLEFIRRINGLNSIDDVKEIVFGAAYLVMGLGDVYLGAPVATPVDPRHRLVTTKYNPARTWTAENSVGIGGSYMCVYGMEGPGGYQFVGRTLQMWNRYRKTEAFRQPWLLRFFDQIRFYPVSQDELTKIREDFPLGNHDIKIEESSFSLSEYETFLAENQTGIDQFSQTRQQAFEDELEQWHANDQFIFEAEEADDDQAVADWPEHYVVADSPVSGVVWQVNCKPGQKVEAGETLMILESMKMEIPVFAAEDGTVKQLLVKEGGRGSAGQALVLIESSEKK